jgi:hypothetical protein
LDTPIEVKYDAIDPPLFWSIEDPGVTMIRFKFESFQAPEFDQMLITDSKHRVFDDLMNDGSKHHWSPWIAGDAIELQVIPTEGPLFGGVGHFSLNITMYEVLEYVPITEPPPISTINPPSSTTSELTTTRETGDAYVLDDIQILFIGFASGIAVLGVIGIVVFRRTGN